MRHVLHRIKLLAVVGTLMGAGVLALPSVASATTTSLYAYVSGTGTSSTTAGCTSATSSASDCSFSHALAAGEALAQQSPGISINLILENDSYSTPFSLDDTLDIDGASWSVFGEANGAASRVSWEQPYADSLLTVTDSRSGGSLSLEDISISYASGGSSPLISDQANAPVTISDSFFSNDNQPSPIIDAGDGVTSGLLTLNHDTFSSDYLGGGAVAVGIGASGVGSLAVTNTTFNNCQSSWNGGAILAGDNYGTATVSISNSTFENSYAGNDGGAIDAGDDHGTATMTDSGSAFVNNDATMEGGAVAIGINGGTATLVDDSVLYQGNNSGDHGGAVNSADRGGHSSYTVSNSAFSQNYSFNQGGAIASGNDVGSTAYLSVSNTTFDSNGSFSGAFGGAIAAGDFAGQSGTAANHDTISGSTFTNNSAINQVSGWGGGGGAIACGVMFWDNTTPICYLDISGSTFSGNSAGISGGAVDAGDSGDSYLAIATSNFSNNTAAASGGAVNFGNAITDQGNTVPPTTADIAVTSSTFSGDTAGGAPQSLSVNPVQAQVTVTSSTSSDNFSSVAALIVQPTVTPSAPTISSAKATANNALTVSWQDDNSSNVPVTGYICSLAGFQDVSVTKDSCTFHGMNLTVAGTYTVSVVAESATGNSDPSQITIKLNGPAQSASPAPVKAPSSPSTITCVKGTTHKTLVGATRCPSGYKKVTK